MTLDTHLFDGPANYMWEKIHSWNCARRQVRAGASRKPAADEESVCRCPCSWRWWKLLDPIGVWRNPTFDLLPRYRRGNGETLARARRPGADRGGAAAVAQIVDEQIPGSLLCGGRQGVAPGV